MTTMQRANRVTVQAQADGYVATFYRTHKVLAKVVSRETSWQADSKANSTAQREAFRQWCTDHSAEYGVDWNPEQQTQAWARKYNRYMTDEQVYEDAITLVEERLYELAEKCRHDMEIVSINGGAVTPKDSTLSYVEDGRYSKDNAWCVADIELTLQIHIYGTDMEMPFTMEMKSGQICKPKTTIAQWTEQVSREMDMQGIDEPKAEDTKTA